MQCGSRARRLSSLEGNGGRGGLISFFTLRPHFLKSDSIRSVELGSIPVELPRCEVGAGMTFFA